MSPAKDAGGYVRSPASALTGIRLLGSIVWHRSRVKISKIFRYGDTETPTSRPCVKELPQELLELIIAHVILDTATLKACSATCRAWYTAVLPHLHHTLTLTENSRDPTLGLRRLQKLDKMQLLPFVKRLRILQASGPPGPRRLLKMFNNKTLAHFSALSNVRELGIDDLDLDTFTPQALLCLNHFASSLRSLALRTPRGSHQQLLHFLGLFPNIDDLKLIYYYVSESSPSDPALVPQSAPSLRGRLRLISFDGEVFLRALSELSGGLRFRYVELLYAKGARFLLNTCANTLEALRIYTGARIQSLGPPETLLQDFGLSNSRSLRSLEITITSLYRNDALSFLRDLLSTITSLVFSEVVIVLEDGDILNVDFFQYTLFGVVRDMYEAKPFRLVFCLEVRDGDLEATVERLKWHIGLEETRGGLKFLSCPPVIITDTLATHGPSAL